MNTLFKCALIACFIMLISQMTWYIFNYEMIYIVGDALFKCGILYAVSRISKWKSFYYFIALDFFFNLAVIDYFFKVFLNPHKVYIHQYLLLIICLLILISRLICYATKLNFKMLLKKIFEREHN